MGATKCPNEVRLKNFLPRIIRQFVEIGGSVNASVEHERVESAEKFIRTADSIAHALS